MKLSDLLERIKTMDHPQRLDEDYDGGCPCFYTDLDIEGRALHLNGKCWRVSECHGLQDLYVWGQQFTQEELEMVGNALKEKLDAQDWYNPYRVYYREP